MRKVNFPPAIIFAGIFIITACSVTPDKSLSDNPETEGYTAETLPPPEKFVKSQLRNSITLELNAHASEVWKTVGDPAKMPEYSRGLEKVEIKRNEKGQPESYMCVFKKTEPGAEQIKHTAKIVWCNENQGWASVDEEPNAFGLKESLTLVTLEEKNGTTILKWQMHFNADTEEMLRMNIESLKEALNKDIANNLLKKFGGRVLENLPEN